MLDQAAIRLVEWRVEMMLQQWPVWSHDRWKAKSRQVGDSESQLIEWRVVEG